MLTIPGHKGNANQNYTNIIPHSCQNSYHQEHQQQQFLARILGKRNAHLLLVGM
jgi:UDP-N-acetyl-D-mannosaminuronic acid transferase (WecB/TagA/CpsF family)